MRGFYWVPLVALCYLLVGSGCVRKIETPVEKRVIATKEAPAAIGPYSQAVQVGDWLFCSGQIAIDPQTGELVTGSIEEETRQVLENLGAVLKAAGMDYSDVVKATVYMTDMADYPRINKVYAEYFKKKPPARAAVAVADLPKGVHVEISVTAFKQR